MKDDGGADNFVAWAMEDEDAPANGAEPISGDVLSYDLGDSYVQADGEPPQTGQGLAFKYFDGLSTSGDRATIRFINFQGELAWENIERCKPDHNGNGFKGPYLRGMGKTWCKTMDDWQIRCQRSPLGKELEQNDTPSDPWL